jgi:hypothetical protein
MASEKPHCPDMADSRWWGSEMIGLKMKLLTIGKRADVPIEFNRFRNRHTASSWSSVSLLLAAGVEGLLHSM